MITENHEDPALVFRRISNMQVLADADDEHVKILIIKEQLNLFGRIATSNATHVLRRIVFDIDYNFRKFSFNPRPIGKSKQCCVDEIYKIALSM